MKPVFKKSTSNEAFKSLYIDAYYSNFTLGSLKMYLSVLNKGLAEEKEVYIDIINNKKVI